MFSTRVINTIACHFIINKLSLIFLSALIPNLQSLPMFLVLFPHTLIAHPNRWLNKNTFSIRFSFFPFPMKNISIFGNQLSFPFKFLITYKTPINITILIFQNSKSINLFKLLFESKRKIKIIVDLPHASIFFCGLIFKNHCICIIKPNILMWILFNKIL